MVDDLVLVNITLFVYRGQDLNDGTIYVSALQMQLRIHILWNEASISRALPVGLAHGDPLSDCIKEALETGFNLFPSDGIHGTQLLDV